MIQKTYDFNLKFIIIKILYITMNNFNYKINYFIYL